MGGQKSTTTTTVTQTPEEKEYTRQQIELAKQQLALTQEEHGWQSEIYAITKPLLEKYGLMVDQEFANYNTPEAQSLRDRYAQLESAQLDSQIRNLPVQDELLQLQLDEIRRGGRATDEQKALIGEIANRAIETGDTDISRFMDKGFQQLREDLAPARGLRPTDSPMLDAGGQVLEEALRQKGQLTSQVRGAQANAELNFPLNASQVYSAQNQFQQNFNANMGQFLSQQRQTAEQNRSALMQQLFTAPMAAREQGISLINASRPNAVSFPRNTTETTKTSGGSILGGIGGLLQGIGAVGGLFSSSEKFKENVNPIRPPEGHVLSPGALKENFRPMRPNVHDKYERDNTKSKWPGNNIFMEAAYQKRTKNYGSTTEPVMENNPGGGPTLYTRPAGLAPIPRQYSAFLKDEWPKVKVNGQLIPYTQYLAQQKAATPAVTPPPGDVLSPGALKQNFRPIGLGFNNRGYDVQTQSEGGGAPAGGGTTPAFAKPPGPDFAVDPTVWGQGKQPQPDRAVDPTIWGQGKKDYTDDGPQVDPTVWGLGLSPKPPGPDYQAGPPQTDEDALARISNLPVSSWNYKPEVGMGVETHVGPMAEDFNTQIMGTTPNPTISIVDALGANMAAIKALERRTRKPSQGVPRNQNWGIQQNPLTQRKRPKFAKAGA